MISQLWFKLWVSAYKQENHYLIQCWPRSMSPYGINGLQWVNCAMPLPFAFRTMIASSNGNTFLVTGLLCEEFTGHRWIPHTKASDAEFWCFFDLHLNQHNNEQIMETLGFFTPSRSLWRHGNAKGCQCDSSAHWTEAITSRPLCYKRSHKQTIIKPQSHGWPRFPVATFTNMVQL